MIWTLLIVSLTSSVCGVIAVKMYTTYQMEEDNNVTIRWDVRTKNDMSRTNMVCLLWSDPPKVLFEMIDGVEAPQSQHQQFAGRVRCDRDALRDGQVRLQVSRVTAEDAGQYRCDVAANYDKILRRWAVEATEHFVLNVASPAENDGVFFFIPPSAEGADDSPGWIKEEVTSRDLNAVVAGGLMFIGSLIVVAAAAQRCLAEVIRRFKRVNCADRTSETGRPLTELKQKINTKMETIV